MSWSLTAIGKPAPVLAVLKADVARNTCSEPEQSIRAAVMDAIELALNAMPEGYAVQVNAGGSQHRPDSTKPGIVNSLKVEIVPIYGFAE